MAYITLKELEKILPGILDQICKTCKYSSNIDGSPKSFNAPPCDECNYNNKWEAKENE